MITAGTMQMVKATTNQSQWIVVSHQI